MKCPICSTQLPLGSDRCPDCGYRPRTAQAAPQTQTTGVSSCYTPPNPTKKSKGCCCALVIIVPVIITILAVIIAATSFVLSEFDFEEFQVEFFEEFEEYPFDDMTPESIPDAADEGCFVIRNGVLTFLPDEWDGSRVLRVPETVDGETVTAIGSGCFRDCDWLTTIILPDTITEIGREAFAGCAELRGLYLPDGLETVGPRAFENCITLRAVYVPATVQEIASGAFDDCASLMYLFYDGDFDTWTALYSDYITPFTAAICLDGTYYHGTVR